MQIQKVNNQASNCRFNRVSFTSSAGALEEALLKLNQSAGENISFFAHKSDMFNKAHYLHCRSVSPIYKESAYELSPTDLQSVDRIVELGNGLLKHVTNLDVERAFKAQYPDSYWWVNF